MDKFQKAVDDYSRAIRLNPKDANAFYNRGVAKTMLGDIVGAHEDWRKAAELGHIKAKELTEAKKY